MGTDPSPPPLESLRGVSFGPVCHHIDRGSLAEFAALGGGTGPPVPLAYATVPLCGLAPRLRQHPALRDAALVLVELQLQQEEALREGPVAAQGVVADVEDRGSLVGLVLLGRVEGVAFRLRFVVPRQPPSTPAVQPESARPPAPGLPLQGASMDQLRRWAALSGDTATEHLEPEAARRLGLSAPSVPGMLALSWVLREHPETSQVRARFRRPLLVDSACSLDVQGARFSLSDPLGAVLTGSTAPRPMKG